MTEAEWLTCTNPDPMLEYVKGKPSKRKLRLFALVCCQRIDHLITDSRSRSALAFVEQHAEIGFARAKGWPGLDRVAKLVCEEVAKKEIGQSGLQQADYWVKSCAASAVASGAMNADPWFGARYAAHFSAATVGWQSKVLSGNEAFSALRFTACSNSEKGEQHACFLRSWAIRSNLSR